MSNCKDEEIDYSDIAPLTDDFFESAVRGWLSLEPRTVGLMLDAEVYEWLVREGSTNASIINHVLRREMQRSLHHRESATKQATSEPSTMSKAS